MLITLSTPTFDPLGFVQIHALPASNTRSITRRVSRVATLDGGVAVNDFGFAEGDRTIEIRFRLTTSIEAAIARLMRLYARVQMITPEGVFTVAISAYAPETNEGRLTALVLSKDSQ